MSNAAHGNKCPHCFYKLLREHDDHTAFMTSRIIAKSDGGMDIVCPGCKRQVEMPGAMQKALRDYFLMRTGD